MRIERSSNGVHRLAVMFGFAVGINWERWPCTWWYFATYPTGGWSLRVLWFHVGRKLDRENWGHWK